MDPAPDPPADDGARRGGEQHQRRRQPERPPPGGGPVGCGSASLARAEVYASRASASHDTTDPGTEGRLSISSAKRTTCNEKKSRADRFFFSGLDEEITLTLPYVQHHRQAGEASRGGRGEVERTGLPGDRLVGRDEELPLVLIVQEQQTVQADVVHDDAERQVAAGVFLAEGDQSLVAAGRSTLTVSVMV